jgi:hypothetical protein
VVEDGLRRVHQVVDWTGSTGTKPVTGLYVGATGLVANIADAKDIRGAQGASGAQGWTPILAVVEDGLRRVHQVVDWTGSTGTKPVTGLYVGATGLVANIADAKDIRGAQGIQGEKGVIITPGSTYTPTTIHVLTQAEYNALTPIGTTLYFIV